MTIHELIGMFPASSIRLERVDQNFVRCCTNKSGVTELTVVTGATQAKLLLAGEGPIGCLLWIDREKWDEAVEASHRKSSAVSGPQGG